MHPRLLPLFLGVLLPFVSACGGEERAAGDLPEVSPARLEEHVRYLASDRLQGRGTGTRGYDSAARYVADRFASLGLDSAGTRGYLQPVPFRGAVAVEGSSLVLARKSERHVLSAYRDYVPSPSYLLPRSEVSAPAVFVGFGVTAPDRGYDDYRGVDARGKIVVLLTGAPGTFPPTERAHHAAQRMKGENAVRNGAVGILVVRTPDQTFPWERLVRQSRAGGLRWLTPGGEPADVLPALKGAATLSDSAAARLFEGSPQPLEQVLAQAAAGKPPAFDLPVRVTLRTVSEHRAIESPNVAGVLPGSDRRLRDEVLVYSAHLDHLGVGEPVEGDSIYNGALDNASGSAALIEIARAFAALPRPPRRSVLFLAVTGEEMGLLGSDYFAEYPTVPIERIVANVNLDGLSLLYPLRELVALGAEHSTLDSTVARAARRLDLTLAPDPFPQEVFFIRSDQYSFVRRGVPSLFPFMGMRSDSGVDAAARFREWLATRYHTPQDDLGQPMDFEAGAGHAQLAFLVGLEIADADQRPAWKKGDFFQRTFGAR